MRPSTLMQPAARRAAILAALVGGALAPVPVAAQPSAGTLGPTAAASHALNRLAFGPRAGQLSEVTRVGWKKWAEQQLDPRLIADAEADKRVRDQCPTLALSLSEFQRMADDRGRDGRREVADELRDAVLLRAVYSNRQFREVMAEFWRNHFNVDVNKVPYLATHYEEYALRPHAFGKFEDLLLAVARHPAMLVYLDNYVSTRRGVNENYARELMELHTLGVDNVYTQKDVEALARVLTGWTCGWRETADGDREYRFFFDQAAHDASPQTVVGLSLAGKGEEADGEKAIRHLARHEGTARFICTKLCRYLVNDDPPRPVVEKAVEVFRDTGGDLTAVYRSIIFHPEFLSPKNYRAKFKTPFEFTVSALRATDARIETTDQLFRRLTLMGQPVYEHVEPTGYSDQREAWLDPGVMVYRWNFAIELVTDQVPGVRVGPTVTDRILKAAPVDRPGRVMEAILPGNPDGQTRKLMTFTSDVRAMTAYALGSPPFQQQ